MTITLKPGTNSLGDWRAIYRGAGATLDPASAPRIAESAAAVGRILAKDAPIYGVNTGFGKLASIRIADADLATLQRNIVLSHAAGVGAPIPTAIARLMVAMKLASLAQGASGVRPETIALLGALLEQGLTPVIPGQGSVGASGDLAPLAHMAATLIGVGEIDVAGIRKPAAEALAGAGLTPLSLGPKEGLALLNGTQFSTACALAGLFEAETAYQAALVTGALSTDAARGSDAPFDPRIHALRPHRGQRETADALRALLAGSAIRASHLIGDKRVQDPYCLRCQPQVMGAVLDILRQAGTTLAIEGQQRIRQPFDLSGDRRGPVRRQLPCRAGGFRRRHDRHGAVRDRLAGRAARRHAGGRLAVEPAGLPDRALGPEFRLHDPAGHRRRAGVGEQAEGLSRFGRFDPDLSQPGGPCFDGRPWRAPAAADGGNATAVIGIELLAAAQGCDFHGDLRSSDTLEAVRALVRAHVTRLEDDRYFHPDLEAASTLVRSGAVAEAAGGIALPNVAE